MSDNSLNDPRLAALPGGWRRQTVDIGWTQVEMALPADPDSLLGDELVLEANRRDDYMPYWASLWPAATQMAAALARADWPVGTRMLELGCGLGLVGIAGALRGWDVLMSDYEPRATAAAQFNAEQNNLPQTRTVILDWRDPPPVSFPVILACDVLYEVRSHAPLLGLLKQMLAHDGCCWLGDPGRTPIVEFYHSATAAGFDVVVRNESGQVRSFPTRGQFQLLQFKRRGGAG